MWKKLKSTFNASKPPELTTIFSAPKPELLTDYERAFDAPPVCYSEMFPDVPKPEQSTVPELIAARWVASDLRPEQTPGIAADLLEAGFDAPSLRRLAGEMQVGCRADVEELVVKMLNELGVEVPDSAVEAMMQATRQIAREAIAGTRGSWKAASALERMWGHDIWDHKYLADVAQLLDELDWDAAHRRPLATLTEELIEILAHLGTRAEGEKRPLRFGLLEGQGWIADDFNDPLPDDILALFEGRDKPDF